MPVAPSIKRTAQTGWILLPSILVAGWAWQMTDETHGAAGLGQPRGESTSEGSNGPFGHQQLQWEEGLFLAAIIVNLWLVVRIQRREADRARSLKSFFSSIAHELRTPIAAIRFEVEGLAERDFSKGLECPEIRRMLDSVGQIQSEFERALDLAALELGGQLPTRPVGLRPLVKQLLRSWRPPSQSTVEFRNEVDEVGVLANPESLNTVLSNVVEYLTLETAAGPQPIVVTFRTIPSIGQVHLLVRNYSETPAESGSTDACSTGCPPFTGLKARLHLIQELMRRMGGKAHFQKVLDSDSVSGFEVHLIFQEEHHHG